MALSQLGGAKCIQVGRCGGGRLYLLCATGRQSAAKAVSDAVNGMYSLDFQLADKWAQLRQHGMEGLVKTVVHGLAKGRAGNPHIEIGQPVGKKFGPAEYEEGMAFVSILSKADKAKAGAGF